MKLNDLNPRWLAGGTDNRLGMGITFDCPTCPVEKNHRVELKFANPLDGGKPDRGLTYVRRGTNFDVLTVTPTVDVKKPGLSPRGPMLLSNHCWVGKIVDGTMVEQKVG